jgi:hypothetical protein
MDKATAFVVSLTLLVPGLRADDNAPPSRPADVATGLDLLKKGDAEADEGKTTDAEIKYQEAMEQLLPGLRKLPFKHTVKRDVTPREKIRDYLIQDFESEMTPEELRAEELSLKAFGLIPRKLDYKETMLKVYSEEIGAFYDPKTDTMHLILESGEGRKPGFLESVLGRKAGFNRDETKITIAHELTHALADQHYDLDKMMEAVKQNDDAGLALAGLIEGEATLVMMGASSEDWGGETTALLPSESLAQAFGLMMPFLNLAGGASLRSAPPIISESLLFPYLRGLVFCAHLTNKGGWKGIDEAYASPPRSTEQILHPEKYLGNRDEPTTIDLGMLDPGAGWKEVRRNVLGELQIGVLVRPFNGREAAAGWDGDQYIIFEGPDDRLALVWASTWDSEEDAGQFARAMARYQKSRFGGDEVPKNVDVYKTSHDKSVNLTERHGVDVFVVEGFEPEQTQRLLELARAAKKSEAEPAAVGPCR